MSTNAAIKAKIKQNSHQLDVLSTADLISAWEAETGKSASSLVGTAADIAADYTSTALDVGVAMRIANDLGFNGRVATKVVGNKSYVIFKGRPGQRSIFTAARYLASNPKVIDMAIGKRGVTNAVVSGGRLTIFLTVPLTVIKHLLDDTSTMFQLVGNITSDIFKIGISASLAGIAGVAAATATTVALGPIVAAIVVGVAASATLEYLDNQFGVTEKLIAKLEDGYDNTFGAFARAVNKLESILLWQARNGAPVGKGIFY